MEYGLRRIPVVVVSMSRHMAAREKLDLWLGVSYGCHEYPASASCLQTAAENLLSIRAFTITC